MITLPDIEAINTTDNLVVTSDDQVLPITTYINSDGERCSADAAICFVAGAADLWFGGKISDFESTGVH